MIGGPPRRGANEPHGAERIAETRQFAAVEVPELAIATAKHLAAEIPVVGAEVLPDAPLELALLQVARTVRQQIAQDAWGVNVERQRPRVTDRSLFPRAARREHLMDEPEIVMLQKFEACLDVRTEVDFIVEAVAKPDDRRAIKHRTRRPEKVAASQQRETTRLAAGNHRAGIRLTFVEGRFGRGDIVQAR